MYSISEFSKLVGVSSRALRLYEEKGLLTPSYRGRNNYRYYSREQLPVLQEIQRLKSLGFSLEEIKNVLSMDSEKFHRDLREKLSSVQEEMISLKKREKQIQKLLSVTEKVERGSSVNVQERRIFMDGVKEEVIGQLRKLGEVNPAQLDYLDRDETIYDSEEKREFLEAVKDCIQFARKNNLILGPARGPSPASIVLYGLGFSKVDPSKYGLLPERFSKKAPDIHIDVEFEGGQIFVDYCRDVSRKLNYGQINAFKMPLLNIIDRVHKRLGAPIAYEAISDDSQEVLECFQKGDVSKIFCYDYSPEALVMKYEGDWFEGYGSLEDLNEYLASQKIDSFREVLNITSLWRPSDQGIIDRIVRYKELKGKGHRYDFLSPRLQEMLRPNHGLIIYQEDIISILHEYTKWSYDRCNQFRIELVRNKYSEKDFKEFQEKTPQKVVDLILEETRWTFCKAHIVSFAQLIKQTAVLKNRYREIYFEEIEKWESEFGFKWDDIGVKLKGVSLLQH